MKRLTSIFPVFATLALSFQAVLGDVNARNGISITTASTINGITPVAAVNGLTVVSGGGGAETTWVSSFTGGTTVASVGETKPGFKLTIGAANITLTQLGAYFVDGANATFDNVTVEIKHDSDCSTVLASVVVPFSGATVPGFNYTALGTPITLLAGNTYHLTRTVGGYNGFLQSPTVTPSTGTVDSVTDLNCSTANGFSALVDFKYTTP